MQIEALDHVAVDITDLAAARKFYGSVLGLEEVPRPPSFDFPGVWYRVGNALIHLVGRGKRDVESKRHFCLWVADIQEAAREIEAAGCIVEWNHRHKIPGVDRFFTYDPDGNRVEFQGSDGTVWAA